MAAHGRRALGRLQGGVVQPLQIREMGAEGGHPQTLLWGELLPSGTLICPYSFPQGSQAALSGAPLWPGQLGV